MLDSRGVILQPVCQTITRTLILSVVRQCCSFFVSAASATAPQDVATGEALDAFVTQQGGKLVHAVW